MDSESSLRSQVAVSFLPKLNSYASLPLIERCGGIEGFFMETETALEALYGELNLPSGFFQRKTALENADRELTEIDRHHLRVCSAEDSDYPPLLRQCEDAPLILFYKGHLQDDSANKYLAVVGTRRASERCKGHVETLIAGLVDRGCRPVIVSGLAFGIDASAHRASLKYGLTTYAVLGHGLQMIYPAAHKELAERILDSGGALISEFPCTVATIPSHFLRRNRIVAGLCQATLIAESAEKGGAMATARLALAYNREVMALPGRPEDKYSAGCNRLIKENIAALTENAIDIAHALHYDVPEIQPQQTSFHFFESGDKETLLLEILAQQSPIDIDTLSLLSHLPCGELSALLLQLELEGKVTALPGKNYAGR
ncbi:MAG: DNA-processing protein DprA [Odoribacter sp.]